MNRLMMSHGPEPRKVLEAVTREKVPAIMSYLSRGKWHATKVIMSDLGANRLDVCVSPREKSHPLNVKPGQQVGMSIKYGYGKFIFEARAIELKPSPKPNEGGVIVLEAPRNIELVQRRSYFRVRVPDNMNVNVQLRLRRYADEPDNENSSESWSGRLVDISAGGMQVVLDASQRFSFRQGQFLGLKFTPLPDEKPLNFNAQVRNIIPTADEQNVCVSLQTVGLEASLEGRSILQQLCNVVERYYQLNQAEKAPRDLQTVS
ncbi:MAG: flagellar brake protein [Planctomycetota bacterium]